ncbi:Nephrin [Mizuhopecten yessoensis]|uniref:Nephrin n=1 Tax=Mizuhopecten yessoensis TaxID=6573 RepID=A0A210PU85_MIZYE|nr:Nephrin [Mizuhopecten yessoensis]
MIGLSSLAQLILLAWSIYEVVGQQYFIETPGDTRVVEGRSTMLNCSIGNRVGKVQWAMDDILLGFDLSIPGYPRYSMLQTSPERYNLYIVNTTLWDDATFECQVLPAQGNPALQASAQLTILVPPEMPKIVGHPNGSIVNIRHTDAIVQLTCEVRNARPAASITWYKNGVVVTENVEYTVEPIANDKRENAHNTLTLTPDFQSKEHGAIYTCKGTNEAIRGQFLETSVTINVQFPPSIPEITGYRRGQTVHRGETMNLECVSRGGNPLAQVVWFKNDVKVDFSYSSSNDRSINELSFTVGASDNDAVYRCEATNAATEYPLTAQVQIVVYFPPEKVTISGNRLATAGEEVELTCETANSNPASVVTWLVRGRQIAGTQSHVEESDDGGYITRSLIRVTLTNREDQIVYTCQAMNDGSSEPVTDTVTLSVLYPPGAPVITGYEEGDFLKAGDVKRLTCSSAGGNPMATLKWFKGNELLDSTTKTRGSIVSSELTLVAAPGDNNAIYKCTASNEATPTPLQVLKKLTVYFPPARVTLTADPSEPKAGQHLRLTCLSASSNPPAAIMWVRDNVLRQGVTINKSPSTDGGMTTTNVLDITPTAADHLAEYHCQATNLVIGDKVNDAITLSVMFAPVFDLSMSPANIEITEGDSRSVNLTAAANPPVLTYKFYRDGIEVSVPGDVNSFTFDSGALQISNIQRGDMGRYSLEARNAEGMSHFNFTLNVLYAASITTITSPVEEEIGGAAFFECIADANPITSNMITWSRSDFDMSKTKQAFENNKGHLTVYELEKTDTGTFTCTADNQIGQPSVMEAILIVKFQPIIDDTAQYSKAAGDHGSTVQLICLAEGAPEVTFDWIKREGDMSGGKYHIESEKVDTIKYRSVVTISDISETEYGTYVCSATNEKGQDTFDISVDGTSRPDQPGELTFINATHDMLTISWNPGFNGGLPQRFKVRYKEKNRPGYTHIDITPIDIRVTTVFVIKGLRKDTSYLVAVLTTNDLGPAEGSPPEIEVKTSASALGGEAASTIQTSDDTPVIIILVVCVVGIFLLALNIGLILFFVRRRKKRLENNSDTTSHTNTIELYGPTKETALYPMTPSDDSRSYGTYEKNMDDFSDDYKNFEHDRKSMHSSQCTCNCVQVKVKTVSRGGKCSCLSMDSSGDEDIKRVFLPPPGYSSRSYTPNKMDSPNLGNTHKSFLTDTRPYLDEERQAAQWQYEDPYRSRNKGTFDSDYMNPLTNGHSPTHFHDYNGRTETRPKSVTDYSDQRSSRSSSRNGLGTTPPPPPPVRSSSKGVANNYGHSPIPPLPARNYDVDDLPPPLYDDTPQPRYAPAPGSVGGRYTNPNVISNPTYEGPSEGGNAAQRNHIPVDDMRGDLV